MQQKLKTRHVEAVQSSRRQERRLHALRLSSRLSTSRYSHYRSHSSQLAARPVSPWVALHPQLRTHRVIRVPNSARRPLELHVFGVGEAINRASQSVARTCLGLYLSRSPPCRLLPDGCPGGCPAAAGPVLNPVDLGFQCRQWPLRHHHSMTFPPWAAASRVPPSIVRLPA